MIYATHDQVEVMTLATRIVVWTAGRIEQVGTPPELCDRPVNRVVAGFIGSPAMNSVNLRAEVGWLWPADGDVALPGCAGAATLGVLPDDLALTDGPAPMRGTVEIVEHLGELEMAYVDAVGPEALMVKLPGTSAVVREARVGLTAPPDRLHHFDAAGWQLAG